jgi:hypothetical protein
VARRDAHQATAEGAGPLGDRPRSESGRPRPADPDRWLEQHVSIVGRTGSGKSYAARGAVEVLLDAGRQVVVPRSTGVWWGLRAGADGGPGFPVPVIGGGRGELRVLRVLVAHGRPATMRLWATLAGLSAKGGTWSTYVSRLRTSGYLGAGVGGTWFVNETGRAAAGEVVPPPSSEELVNRWCEAVGAGGAGRMLAVLAGRYPATVDREALAQELGLAVSGGTFSTYLSRLVSNGLATRLPEGVRAAGELFPAGSEAR